MRFSLANATQVNQQTKSTPKGKRYRLILNQCSYKHDIKHI